MIDMGASEEGIKTVAVMPGKCLPLPDRSWWPVYRYWRRGPDGLCNVIPDSFTIDVFPMHIHVVNDFKHWLPLSCSFQKDRKSWWFHAVPITYRLASEFKGTPVFSKEFILRRYNLPHPVAQNAQLHCTFCTAVVIYVNRCLDIYRPLFVVAWNKIFIVITTTLELHLGNKNRFLPSYIVQDQIKTYTFVSSPLFNIGVCYVCLQGAPSNNS